MDLGIKGKYALVTGGSHGIGLATAHALAREGCHVALTARKEDRLNQAVRDIQAHDVEAVGVSADALLAGDIERVMKEVIRLWGTLHILVNNVGGGGRWGSDSVEETPEEVWKDVYHKNVTAALRFTKQALPWMRKQHWGRVVTVASLYGREGGGRPWYSMAKAAEISLMKSLSMKADLIRDGITFNSVAPGSIMIPDTGWEKEQKKDPSGFEKMVQSTLPLGRLGTPEEVAQVIVFLSSEQASFVNGTCVAIDGGEGRSF